MSIRAYTELLLYGLLLFSLVLHRVYGLPNLSIIALLLPLVFLPLERFGVKSPWNLSLLALPLLYVLHPQNFMQRFSNLTVSVLFTIPHIILYVDLWSVLTFFPSLLYGYIYQRTGSLAFVSLLHLASNLLWFTFLAKLLSKIFP